LDLLTDEIIQEISIYQRLGLIKKWKIWARKQETPPKKWKITSMEWKSGERPFLKREGPGISQRSNSTLECAVQIHYLEFVLSISLSLSLTHTHTYSPTYGNYW
jgi:hypothetical protein